VGTDEELANDVRSIHYFTFTEAAGLAANNKITGT
jgi:hypothetical protein